MQYSKLQVLHESGGLIAMNSLRLAKKFYQDPKFFLEIKFSQQASFVRVPQVVEGGGVA